MNWSPGRRLPKAIWRGLTKKTTEHDANLRQRTPVTMFNPCSFHAWLAFQPANESVTSINGWFASRHLHIALR
eukprot:4815473-Pyramimonas_sp.AAC.1